MILFGGQGSLTIFSPHTAAAVEEDARSTSAALLLSRCHATFLEEIASLDIESRKLLGVDTAHFTSPRELLVPNAQYHTHPILQATTVFFCQTLHYLAQTQQLHGTFEESFREITETAGFSSGLLPAAVVARSSTSDDFVVSATAAFRLAFWTACRSYLWTLQLEKDDSNLAEADSDATLSLVIRGEAFLDTEGRLAQHVSNHHAEPSSGHSPRRLHISAKLNSNIVSISGPKADLCAFRRQIPPPLTTTFAHVHGWYHGGDQLEPVVQQVLEDCRRRSISFPHCPTPAKPIRSTMDGTLFDSSTVSEEEFLLWLARHLLVHCVDWCKTSHAILAHVRELRKLEPDVAVKIISFGPSSSSLLSGIDLPESGVEMMDLSPFKTTGVRTGLSSDYQDSIAIVGMSVNLPAGKGTEQLWETLSQGLSAVKEIPEARFKVSDYYTDSSDNLPRSRSMSVRHGAFLDDPFL